MRHRVLLGCLALSLGFAPFPAVAQTDDFEALVQDALGREQPPVGAERPAGDAPISAVPRRLLRRPPPAVELEAAPVQQQPPLPAPVIQEPTTAAPVQTPAPGPKPYTPPRRAVAPPAEAPAGASSAGAPAPLPAPGAPTEPPATTEAPARSVASLDVDEVNGATLAEGMPSRKGASPLILKAQILLDRAGASPGVIDAIYGGNVAKAIVAVETVLGLPVDGQLDPQVWAALGGDQASPVLVEYTITEEDASYPFLASIPRDYADQAQLEQLGFTSPQEMFGERFHMDIKLVDAFNPGANWRQPGATIIVAAIQGQPVTGKIARIEADKASRQVRAFDAADRLIVAYPATIGSSDNPSPSGTHQVNTIAPNPVYYYNPKNFVQGNNTEKLELPPGPNNPVGTMWIDLSEPSYGIHGTPEPSKIDKTGSHGCVRLTNWDAEELASLVDPGVIVSFLE